MTTSFWFLLGQDLDRPIGGVKQIYRLAEALSNIGFRAYIVQKTSEFRPSWFILSEGDNLSFVSLEYFKNVNLIQESAVLVLPETIINLFFNFPGVPKIIFNQNYGYTFGEKLHFRPDFVRKVYSSPELIKVLCISASDNNFLRSCLGLDSSLISRLINPIEVELFQPSFPKNRTIAFMPRKNSQHASIVTSLLSSSSWFTDLGWSILPLSNLSHQQIAKHLQDSFIFLSFGTPEGFGLPIAEALASGCHVVGYDGVGGSELFSLVSSTHSSHSVSYFDFYSFYQQVKNLVLSFESEYKSLSDYSHLLESSSLVRKVYNFSNFTDSVAASFACFKV